MRFLFLGVSEERERERERESFVLKSFDVCYITLMTLFRGCLIRKSVGVVLRRFVGENK